MQVKNNGTEARTLSHGGKDHLLLPGNFVEVELTKDEAKVLGKQFEITGEPSDAKGKAK